MKTAIATVLLALAPGALLAQAQPSSSSVKIQPQKATALPDTPTGRQVAAFFAALNTGDRETIRRFVKEHFDKPPNGVLPIDEIADHFQALFNTSRGLEVRKIAASSSASITAIVQTKLTESWMQIQVFVAEEPSSNAAAKALPRIRGVGVRNMEIPTEFLPNQKLTTEEIRDKLDTLMSKLVGADLFSGIVYVAKDGEPLYARAFGLANRSWNVPNKIDTKFNLASITKMFTAVAVAQLVEQGKLSYADTVEKVLPDYPNKEVARKVTVHHLLSHTSGMIGAQALADRTPQPPIARSIDEMIRPFVNDPLSHPPGQQYDYSNAGFILLGALIEKVSGQSYFDYVRDHIFKPADMSQTDFYALDTDPRNLATGYKDGPNGTRLNNIFDLGVKGSPAGMSYSTGEDMTRFYINLIHHKLLTEHSLKTLWTGVTEQPEGHSEYGYGAQIEYYKGARIVGHGGGWKGITNQFEFYPELGYTVVILSNYDDDPKALANKLREWLNQGSSQEEPMPQAPPALTMAAEVSPTTVAKGSPITIKVMAKNSGGVAHASIIDLEVKDTSGAKANQQFTMGQKIAAGQTKTYTYSWTPMAAGKYTVDIGSFGPGWNPKHRFESGVATITVK
jgi:CubicO group peptidase (beta-lactamase class C family)